VPGGHRLALQALNSMPPDLAEGLSLGAALNGAAERLINFSGRDATVSGYYAQASSGRSRATQEIGSG